MFAAGGLTPPETKATKEAPASPRWGFSPSVPRGGDGGVQGELGARPFMNRQEMEDFIYCCRAMVIRVRSGACLTRRTGLLGSSPARWLLRSTAYPAASPSCR